MNPDAQPSAGPSAGASSTPPRGRRPGKVWRVFRVVIFSAVCLATLLFLINAEENWRAGRLWKQCRQDLEKRGEKLDVKDFLPNPVPPDQNFTATPLLAAALAEQNPRNPLDLRLGREDALPSMGLWRLAKPTDLRAWRDYLENRSGSSSAAPPRAAAEEVLRSLSRFDAPLAELRAAGERPCAQFSVRLDAEFPGLFLPSLGLVKGLSQTMALHATAAAAAGRGGEALADLKVNWRLLEALKSEPVLITLLVRLAIHEITLQPVWEGLAARCWDEPQLAALNQELARLDFLAEAAQALRGERAFMNATFDQLIQKPPSAKSGLRSPGGSVPLAAALFPRWMIYRNQALATRYQQEMIDRLDQAWREPETTAALDLSFTNRWSRELQRTSPNNFLAKLLLPALSSGPPKVVRAQTTLTLARAACALERYRLARGAYPEKLEQLVPQYLPKVPLDPYAGRPLQYRLERNGRFVLYSIGPNQKDDGGRVEKTEKDNVALDQGDWVWASP